MNLKELQGKVRGKATYVKYTKVQSSTKLDSFFLEKNNNSNYS